MDNLNPAISNWQYAHRPLSDTIGIKGNHLCDCPGFAVCERP